MDTSQILKDFAKFLGVQSDINVDESVTHIEDTFFPEVMKILQKDDSFFAEERVLFGVNLSAAEVDRAELWKNIQGSLFASFLHGDIRDKLGKVVDVVKKVWNGSGQTNEDLDKILNDDESEGKLKELLDYVMECRLAKMFMNIVESFDISDIEINFDSPEELIELVKNPENPVVQKLMKKMQKIIETKMKNGELSQQLIESEIHGIKNKILSIFGNVFNDFLGGRKADVSSNVLMANTTEGRRQRMLARLQRKLREKNSK